MAGKKGTIKEVSSEELADRLKDGGGGGDDDRREQPRHEARLEIDVPLANWEQVRRVYTTNISKGGLLFSLKSPASIPAAVDLTLTLPDGNQITLQSEVRHVARRDGGEYDVGVQFQKLEAKAQRAFEEALARLAK